MVKAANLKRFFGGIISLLFGILSLIWTPYDLLLEERLRMRPGLPPFDWWYNPPDVQRLNMYIFNITNADRFTSGEDTKLKMEEVGPIIFRQVVTYSDVVFNENGTMSYTSRKSIVYDPSLNHINMNDTVVVPNLAVLLAGSYYWKTNFIMRTALNYMFEKVGETIIKRTIYEFLYNNTDPLLTLGYKVLQPIIYDNTGLIPLLNKNCNNRVTVYTGTKFGHQKFLLIDKYNGSSYVPSSKPNCKDDLTGASESVTFSQKVPKTKKIRYFYDLMCKPTTFLYEDEVYRRGLKAYRFALSKYDFDRTQPPDKDCYKGYPTLLNGLIDISSCWGDFPVAASQPHFLYGDPKLLTYVDGMKPNASLHSSANIMEPESGIILEYSVKLQVNLQVRPLKGFHKIFDKFSDTILPYCYVEMYGEPPQYVMNFLYFTFSLPIISPIVSALSIIFGSYCIWICGCFPHIQRGKRFLQSRAKKRKDDASMQQETEKFLNDNRLISLNNEVVVDRTAY